MKLAFFAALLVFASANAFAQSTNSIDIDASNDYENPVAPVSSAIASHCINAVAGASTGGGVNIGIQDPICQHLKMAEVALEAYNLQRVWCSERDPACDRLLMEGYLVKYRNNLADAERIMSQTSLAGQAGVTALQAAPAIALLWLLVLL